MKLDVLSVLQANPAASAAETGLSQDMAPDATPEGLGFASVFAQLMPSHPQGQHLAVEPEVTTDAVLPAEPEISTDPSLAWFNAPTVQANPMGLQAKTLDSGQMKLITPHQPSPDADGDGLLAFAQGQGLDETALKRLFGDAVGAGAAAVPKTPVVPAAAWIAGGQRNFPTPTPVMDPALAAPDGLPDHPLLDRAVLSLLPLRRAGDPNPLKPTIPASFDPSLVMAGETRVDMDLDVGALLSELAPDADLKALKAEERAALSLRIGEMLAQRMVAQAQRGQWQLRLALHPQNLGRVEIDMQMRGGELEASFASLNPATRELLQEALPRLREMLQQSGMDVASLNVGSGGASKHGGQPTPRGQGSGSGEGDNTPADVSKQHVRVQGADGWDIWV